VDVHFGFKIPILKHYVSQTLFLFSYCIYPNITFFFLLHLKEFIMLFFIHMQIQIHDYINLEK